MIRYIVTHRTCSAEPGPNGHPGGDRLGGSDFHLLVDLWCWLVLQRGAIGMLLGFSCARGKKRLATRQQLSHYSLVRGQLSVAIAMLLSIDAL